MSCTWTQLRSAAVRPTSTSLGSSASCGFSSLPTASTVTCSSTPVEGSAECSPSRKSSNAVRSGLVGSPCQARTPTKRPRRTTTTTRAQGQCRSTASERRERITGRRGSGRSPPAEKACTCSSWGRRGAGMLLLPSRSGRPLMRRRPSRRTRGRESGPGSSSCPRLCGGTSAVDSSSDPTTSSDGPCIRCRVAATCAAASSVARGRDEETRWVVAEIACSRSYSSTRGSGSSPSARHRPRMCPRA